MKNNFNTYNKMKIGKSLAIALLLSLFMACETDETTTTFKDVYSTFYTYLEDNEELSLYKAIVDSAAIGSTGQSMKDVYTSYNTYNGNNTSTLFLPDNAALEVFLQERNMTISELLSSPSDCWNISANHLVLQPLYSKDFPNGELPESSLNGQTHTIRYEDTDEGVSFLINETASVIIPDYTVSNGIIHVIDAVLVPISYTACEWIRDNDDYQIFNDALLLTGLFDELQYSDILALTMFAESDEVFQNSGIYSIDDLKAKYSPSESNYTDQFNPLYQFVAYHIIKDKSIFISDMDSNLRSSYETYASYPLSIKLNPDYSNFEGMSAGIALNKGFEIIDTIVDGSDTTFVDYVSLYGRTSNQPTLDGVVHSVNHILDVDYTISADTALFEFDEDPAILTARSGGANLGYRLRDDQLESFTFGGDLEYIYYERSDDEEELALSQDWIRFSGFYEINYTTPRFIQGDYQLDLRLNTSGISGLVDVYLDGKRVGATINLGSLAPINGEPWVIYTVGYVRLQGYEEHVVTLKAVTPGYCYWDFVRFNPIEN